MQTAHPHRRGLIAGVTLVAATGLATAAAGSSTPYWDPQDNVLWHHAPNWTSGSVPAVGDDVYLAPIEGPNPALIWIDPASGPARASTIFVLDWPGVLAPLDYAVNIQPLPGSGGQARLLVPRIEIIADESTIFGDGEAVLSVTGVDIVTSRFIIEEQDGADASVLLSSLDFALQPGHGFEMGVGTQLRLDGAHLHADSPGFTFELDVPPTSSLIVGGSFGESTIRDSVVQQAGQLLCFGTLRVEQINSLGSTILEGNLIIDGEGDSALLGPIVGNGIVTVTGPGTVSFVGQPKTLPYGITLAGGVAQASNENQLGAGFVRFNGGALEPVGGPQTFNARPLWMQDGGGEIRTTTVPLSVSTSIGGPGSLVKSGGSILALHGSSTYGGDTTVTDGILQVNNTSGAGTGAGTVHVAAGGTLSGTGSLGGPLVVEDGGRVAPGIAAPFQLESLAAPEATFASGSTFDVRIGGTIDRDSLGVYGPVTIEPGATMRVTLVNGYVPQPGDAIRVIGTEHEITGAFDLVAADGPWCTEVVSNGIVLRYGEDCAEEDPFPCPADVDGDETVGFNDLLAVLADFGACSGCAADVTGDEVVDFNDLLEVLASWGPCS